MNPMGSLILMVGSLSLPVGEVAAEISPQITSITTTIFQSFFGMSRSRQKGRATITPTYERNHLLGGTFSTAFGNLIVRGEVAWFFDRFFSTNDVADAYGVVKTNELFYVGGFDWFGFTDKLLSFQFFQNVATNNTPELIRDSIDSDMSFLVQRRFWNETVTLENLWIQDMNRGDGMLQPKVSYDRQRRNQTMDRSRYLLRYEQRAVRPVCWK